MIQLKSEGARLPFRPNGARLTMKAVVPVSGPARLADAEEGVDEVPDEDRYDRLPERQPEGTIRAP